jgi:hypothetical protein
MELKLDYALYIALHVQISLNNSNFSISFNNFEGIQLLLGVTVVICKLT